MPDGSWKREGEPEMMVYRGSAQLNFPKEKMVPCHADHSQIAKLRRGESGAYPDIKRAVKQALLRVAEEQAYVKLSRLQLPLDVKEATYPQPSSLRFEDSHNSDPDESASSGFSGLSVSSRSSRSSHTTINDTLVAALDEVVAFFMGDEDLQYLFAEAFIKQDREAVSKRGVRLLKWLGRRLVVAANTPLEKEAAKLFLIRRHNCAIIDKIARHITTKTLREERQEEAKIKQERVELYLRKQMGTATTETIHGRGISFSKGWNDSEHDTSSDSEHEEKDKEQTVQLNVDEVKLFLTLSDGFARFKEEFEDLIDPFQSKTMWTKTLWNGRERVRFEHSSSVPRLTSIDKLKLVAEEKLGMPILWWPLKQPRKHLSSGKVRIIWICVGHNHILP